jgi:hypothetical protein
VTWLEEVRRELAAAHIPAGRRRRIVAEFEDHLQCDPSAAARLGNPAELARRFADEVGTALSRRAAFAVFAGLVPLGLMFVLLFALLGPANFTSSDPNFVGGAVILGTQVAFVGGMLALLRAWRLRRATVVPAAQSAVLLRRCALGLAGGLLTIAGIVVGAAQTVPDVAAWFAPLAYAIAAVGAVTLAAASVPFGRALRLQPVGTGAASGDLESDLGSLVPAGLRGRPWRLAIAIAALVALCISLAGVVQGDTFDGLARAFADGLACLIGFAALGRWLGLRA